jgi:hypothetical protein
MQMSKRRKSRVRQFTPLVLGWSKREQQRFIETVERLHSMVNDLDTILTPVKRRRAMKVPPQPETPPPSSNGQPTK